MNRLMREARRRAKLKGIDVDIDTEYLLYLLEVQDGRCVYTNITLTRLDYNAARRNLPRSGNRNPIDNVSLDRKDSSLGYVRGNVQLITVMANWAKNKCTDEQMRDFIHRIKEG